MPDFVITLMAAPPALPSSASKAVVFTFTSAMVSDGATYALWCGSQMLTLTAPSVRVVFIFAAVPLMFVRSERPGVSVAEFCVPAGVAPGTRLMSA